jgi:hypothetical protein
MSQRVLQISWKEKLEVGKQNTVSLSQKYRIYPISSSCPLIYFLLDLYFGHNRESSPDKIDWESNGIPA